ncbi:kinase-like domain-containing protein, partial [Hysterangium stoloniferum]
NIAHEAYVWSLAMPHENILPLLGVARLNNSVALISPWKSQGNLSMFLEQNPSANKIELLASTARGGLTYLHSRSPPVIHGDMKGANILVSDEGSAVLADFGLSRISHEATTSVLRGAGSPRWMAPELVISGDIQSGPLRTVKSDVYGFGHVLLEVLTNQKPFANIREDLHVLVELIKGRRPQRPTGGVAAVWLNDDAWSYCQTCTNIDPDCRPDMETVLIPTRLTVSIPVLRQIPDLSNQITLLGDFPIASGAFSAVWLGKLTKNNLIAGKILHTYGNDSKLEDDIAHEAHVWSLAMPHENVLPLLGVARLNNSVALISPWQPQGDLSTFLRDNPSANKIELLSGIARGLAHLHGRGIIYGYLTAVSNILVSDEGSAVLADFGLSRISHEATTSVLRGGSPRWMAPELVISGDIQSGPLRTMKSDVYGFGHVLLEVLTNQKPFANIREDLHVLVELIKGRRPQRPTGVAAVWLNDDAWSYCQTCTNIDPDCRPDMETVVTDLRRLFSENS